MANLSSLGQMDVFEIDGIVQDGKVVRDPTSIARRMILSDLRRLNIRPFKQVEVEDYKASKTTFTRTTAEIADILKYLAIPLYLIASALVTIVSATSAQVSGNAFGPSLPALLVFAQGLAVASALTWGFHQVFKAFNGSRWDYTELNLFMNHMNRSVPEHIQQLAGRLRHARPDLGIKVEFFKLDPFLVVYDYNHPDAFYTIAVWDESGYRIAYA